MGGEGSETLRHILSTERKSISLKFLKALYLPPNNSEKKKHQASERPIQLTSSDDTVVESDEVSIEAVSPEQQPADIAWYVGGDPKFTAHIPSLSQLNQPLPQFLTKQELEYVAHRNNTFHTFTTRLHYNNPSDTRLCQSLHHFVQ